MLGEVMSFINCGEEEGPWGRQARAIIVRPLELF